MDPEPQPCELPPLDEEAAASSVVAVRELFCPHYDSCLSIAVRSRWADWTCGRCPLRHAAPRPSATRFAQDRHLKD
jgi:hypothetical protein